MLVPTQRVAEKPLGGPEQAAARLRALFEVDDDTPAADGGAATEPRGAAQIGSKSPILRVE
jgi:hypothetical protein